jgi:predicted DNA-binding transcriptional regulator AlpA
MDSSETTMDLVGTKEVADLLAVTTKRVHQLVGTGTFPRPVAELACGRIWRTKDIRDWKEKSRPEHGPSSRPDIPPRDPAMRSTDPWDADAIRWLLGFKGAETFRPHELLACLRNQPSARRRDPDRVEEAHRLAWEAELTVGRDIGGQTIHLFRSDLGRPTMYPRSAAERRKWLKAHGWSPNH